VCTEKNFLNQVIDSPTGEDAILDLMVTNASELICDIKFGGSMGGSDHALVESAVLKVTSQAKSKVSTLNFRKANLQLFKELVNESPWETALRDMGTWYKIPGSVSFSKVFLSSPNSTCISFCTVNKIMLMMKAK